MASSAQRVQWVLPPVGAEELLARAGNDSVVTARARKQALAWYGQAALPGRWQHLWRYDEPGLFLPRADRLRAVQHTTVRADPPPDGVAVYLGRDGGLAQAADLAASGVRTAPLAGVADVPLAQVVPPEHGVFEALHTALWTDGILVDVAPHADISSPVTVHLHVPQDAPYLRVFVRVGQSARCALHLRLVGPSKGHTAWVVMETDVATDASLHQLTYVEVARKARLGLTARTRLAAGAGSQEVLVPVAAGHLKADVGVVLTGAHASGDQRTFVAGRDGVVRVHAVADHTTGPGTSSLGFRSVVGGAADVATTSRIAIGETAAGVDARQHARNLVLEKSAKVAAIPELEIHNNDVTCSHGVATGPVDEDALFYLMARGLPRAAAVRLLAEGVLADLLDGVPVPLAEAATAAVQPVWHQMFG